MRPRIDRKRVRTAVRALVVAFAGLTVYATATGNSVAVLATDLLFGLFVIGFGALLLARGSGTRLLTAGGLLVAGGGLALLDVVEPVPVWLADPPVLAGLGLYVHERWLRRGTDRPDPLDPENA